MLRKRRTNVYNRCIIYHLLLQSQTEAHARQLFVTEKISSTLKNLIQNYLQARKG